LSRAKKYHYKVQSAIPHGCTAQVQDNAVQVHTILCVMEQRHVGPSLIPTVDTQGLGMRPTDCHMLKAKLRIKLGKPT